jgi:hypothetical protein
MQTSVVDVNDSGIAAGILVSFRLFGGLIGLSICAAIFNDVFEKEVAFLPSFLPSFPPSLELLRDVREATSFIPELKKIYPMSEFLAPILRVYRQCFKAVFCTLASTGIVGLLSSFLIQDLTLENSDAGRQRFVTDA